MSRNIRNSVDIDFWKTFANEDADCAIKLRGEEVRLSWVILAEA